MIFWPPSDRNLSFWFVLKQFYSNFDHFSIISSCIFYQSYSLLTSEHMCILILYVKIDRSTTGILKLFIHQASLTFRRWHISDNSIAQEPENWFKLFPPQKEAALHKSLFTPLSPTPNCPWRHSMHLYLQTDCWS